MPNTKYQPSSERHMQIVHWNGSECTCFPVRPVCIYCDRPTDDGFDEHEECFQRSAAQSTTTEVSVSDSTTIEPGSRVLLPNFSNSRTFTYASVLEVAAPNVKVKLERPRMSEREPFWTTLSRCVIARQQRETVESLATTRRAESIREETGCSWELACKVAEAQRDALADGREMNSDEQRAERAARLEAVRDGQSTRTATR